MVSARSQMLDKAAIEAQNQEFSRGGLRVLAFAYKKMEDERDLCLEDENDLILPWY